MLLNCSFRGPLCSGHCHLASNSQKFGNERTNHWENVYKNLGRTRTFCFINLNLPVKINLASLSKSPPMTDSQAKEPEEVYDGGHAGSQDVRLRIANGGAGQIGLIRALANKFIEYMVLNNEKPFKVRPTSRHWVLTSSTEALFGVHDSQVAWYKGDTTESLELLSSGTVDVALTYNPAAEKRLLGSGDAVQRVLVYNVRQLRRFVLNLNYPNQPFRIISSSQDPNPTLQD